MRTENFLWIGKNFIRMILLLAAVSVVTFTLVSISPIDPLQANVGQTALGSMSEEQIEKLEHGDSVCDVERLKQCYLCSYFTC